MRTAKKAGKPAKIGMPEARPEKNSSKAKGKKDRGKRVKVTGKGTMFGQDMGDKRRATEGARAKKGDRIKGLGIKPSKGGKGKKRK